MFNPDTASTLEYRLKDDTEKEDETVIQNVYASGHDADMDMVVSVGSVDVRKPLDEDRLYMSGDEVESQEGANEDMDGMVCVVWVWVWVWVHACMYITH